MAIKFGLFNFNLEELKSYNQLTNMINREKGVGYENIMGNPKKQLQEYRSWVYSCVSLVQERISSIPYSFYSKRTEEEIKPGTKGYEIFTKPFRKPNDLMTFRFLKSFVMVQLDLCGMSCVYPARNQLGQVWELWPLNMNDFLGVKVYGHLMNQRAVYSFNMGGKQLEFDSRELIILNYPNPINIHEPMSPIQAQAYGVDIDKYIEVYQRDFFKNSARIDMALYTEQPVEQDKADEIRSRWINKYGKGNYHDVAVLSSGLKPVPLKYTNKDFEFMNLADWSLNKTIAAYHIPLSKLGFSKNDRSGSVADDISFNRECIQPRLTLLDEEFTEGVLQSFNDDIEIRHNNPIPRDRELEVKEARIYLGGLPCYTINEYREERKLPRITEGGDTILVPQGWVPINKIEKYLSLQNNNSGDSQTDPTRHDNDDPHLNPSGTDDRDDSPTEGRSFGNKEESLMKNLNKFFSIEKNLREPWTEYIKTSLQEVKINSEKQQVSVIFAELIQSTIKNLFVFFDVEEIEYQEKNWVYPIAERTALEFCEAVSKVMNNDSLSWKDGVISGTASNTRMIKIINFLVRATINYTKWLIMQEKNIEPEWVINSNECGHKGRLISFGKGFGVGATKIDFPNQTLIFDCDCTLKAKNNL